MTTCSRLLGFDLISSDDILNVYVSVATGNWAPPTGGLIALSFATLLQSDLSPQYWQAGGFSDRSALSTDRSGYIYKCNFGIKKLDHDYNTLWTYGTDTAFEGTPCTVDENGFVYGLIVGTGAVKLNQTGQALWTYTDSDFYNDVVPVTGTGTGDTYGVMTGQQHYIATDENGDVYFACYFADGGFPINTEHWLVKVDGQDGSYINSVKLQGPALCYVTGPVRGSDGSITIYRQQQTNVYDDVSNFATDLSENWSFDFSSSRSFQQGLPTNFYSYPMCATHDGGLILVGKNSAAPNDTFTVKRFELSDQSETWSYTFSSQFLTTRQVAVDGDNNVYFGYYELGNSGVTDFVVKLGAAAGGVSASGLDNFSSSSAQLSGIAVLPGTAPYSKL